LALTEISFDYPKHHYIFHLFAEIERKGPTMHYSAILGEMLHIGIKADARRTNGRDADDQVS